MLQSRITTRLECGAQRVAIQGGNDPLSPLTVYVGMGSFTAAPFIRPSSQLLHATDFRITFIAPDFPGQVQMSCLDNIDTEIYKSVSTY